MSLSARACEYLATFQRREPVAVPQVREALERAGCPAVDAWLDFHLRFGGYEEIIGREVALWGLAHADPMWLDPGEVAVDREDDGWRIVCADVHPSYDYTLDFNGEFDGRGGGGAYESFDVKVERDAVFWEATQEHRSLEFTPELAQVPGIVEKLRRLSAEMVPHASDKYATCWRAQDAIVVDRRGDVTVWVASDARERLTALLQET